jgi:hypothetical protein
LPGVSVQERPSLQEWWLSATANAPGTGVALTKRGGQPMAEEKKVTETETKVKNDFMGNPKEQKTTTKETKIDSSGNKQQTKTEYKEKR